MDMLRQDSSCSLRGMSELRLILVGNIGCGKTLTADTLLNDSSSIVAQEPSRLSEVRRGTSEGRQLRVVETPRWYWKGEHIDASVQRETERALSLVAPGPHAFLILVPVGQFTEMEGRIPTELERVFGKGALEHTLVLLTCGDYLIGRDHDRYVRLGEPGLNAMVDECGGHWHIINNRRPQDRQQVISLLEKVEQLIERSGGCYLPSEMQREVEDRVREKERELQRRYSLHEDELVRTDHRTVTQTTWSKEETWDESGRRGKIRIRSMGPATGRAVSQQLANGLHSQSSYDDMPVGIKPKQSSFKLTKEGAILSKMSETDHSVRSLKKTNFINSYHYQISSTEDTSSDQPSIPSPTADSYSPSTTVFSPLSSITFSSSASSAFAPSSSTNLPSSPAVAPSSSTNFSSSSAFAPSSSKAISSSSSTAISSSSSTAISSSSFTAISSFPTNDDYSSTSTALSSSKDFSSSSHRNNKHFSTSSTAISSSPSTNTSFLSSSTAVSSSSPSTNATFPSSSTSLSSRPTTASSSSFSSGPSDELRLVLLGRTGSGKSAAGNAILGRNEFKLRKDDATGATTQLCVKGTAMVGQRRVAVVDTPDLFLTSCTPENLATHLSSCMAMCDPGPHALLLCVPVTLPGRSNLHDLGSLRNTFGSDALRRHTVVLFTHADMLKDGNVEEYIAAKRPELLELVEKCGDRYHVLKHGRNVGDIDELLEKVEQTVKESGGNHYSYQEQGEIGRERMMPLRRGRGEEVEVDRAVSGTLHSLREEEEIEHEEKNVKPVESTASSVRSMLISTLCSVLHFVWQKAMEGAKQVPKLVAGGAMLGGALGLYVGGPVGGAVGATAGSVGAEYGRRKYSKTKID